MGIGAAPNTGLAEVTGLDVRNGVVTDASLRTSDPDIYAAGDIASAFQPLLGTRIRVEHWANALFQPETAAASMLGRDSVYDRVPYLYTDQYDLSMEYAGHALPGGYDEVVFRGDVVALLTTEWVCQVCGEAVRGQHPPLQCPKCASPEHFVMQDPCPGD